MLEFELLHLLQMNQSHVIGFVVWIVAGVDRKLSSLSVLMLLRLRVLEQVPVAAPDADVLNLFFAVNI